VILTIVLAAIFRPHHSTGTTYVDAA